MKQEVIRKLENFLNDFHYYKIEGHNAFQQLFKRGSKIVVLNATAYEDGLMLEVQLAIRVDEIEANIFRFYKQQETEKLSLSYWENHSQISLGISKRNLIQNEIELSKILSEIENAFVKEGFKWLDDLSNLNNLSEHLKEVIFSSVKRKPNLFKLCQRSYLLQILLGEKITDAVFMNITSSCSSIKFQNIN